MDLDLLIAANGKKMQHFYNLPQKEREKLLETITATNRMLDDYKE